jgi:hypothetical protein
MEEEIAFAHAVDQKRGDHGESVRRRTWEQGGYGS